MSLFDIVAGWTGVLGPFTLKLNGSPFDLTGMTVEPSLRDGLGANVTFQGTVTVDPDQVNYRGQVSLSPTATDFVFNGLGNTSRQVYKLHWKVTDGSGRIVYFPNGDADEIGVYKP